MDNKYTKTAIYLHWLIALLLVLNVILGWTAELLPEADIRFAINTHKSIGICVLGLVLMRLLWRFSHQAPALPATFQPWERKLAKLGHIGLYFVMLAVPISGWMHDSAWKNAASQPMQLFYLVPWPRIQWITELEPGLKETLHTVFGAVHEYLSFILVALFLLHIAAVIKHSYFDKQAILKRMVP